MRLRRLCEVKGSGKKHVPEEVMESYRKSGEEREWLELALLEAIKKVGTDRKKFKQVKERVVHMLNLKIIVLHALSFCLSLSISL